MSANFDELLPKVSTWDVEEEEILINKIKQLTEDYQQKCSDLSINLNNMNRNLHLIEVDFFNTLNGLKSISGKKFIEHIIDTEDIKPQSDTEEKKDIELNEENMNNSVNSIIQRGLEFVAFRDQQKSQNKNNVEDDTVSMNSKVMDNNLMKNNRGLKLPLIIGSKDFQENDYIGLVLDDEEEENFDNEIRNEQGVVIPNENGVQDKEINLNNNNNVENINNLNNNNPEEFHNMVQQQMGKPILSQNMFEKSNENNEEEKEFENPAMASAQVEDIGGLGGLLRSSSLQQKPPNTNNIIPNANNLYNDNLNKPAINPNLHTSIPGGKFNINSILSKGIFADDDDDEDDSGLFGRPGGKKRGLGMSMIPNSNMNLNDINNNQNMPQQNMMNNNIMMNAPYQNNNNLQFNQPEPEKPIYDMNMNNNVPLNQRMEMAPSPLLLSMKQNNINPQIQPQIDQNNMNMNNNIPNKEEENNDDNLNDFQKRKKNIEKLFNHGQNQQMIKPQINPENQNQELNNELNLNENKEINNNPTPVVNNTQTIFMSQRELENKLKLEKAKTKINFIFGDDEDEEDDIFSKKITTNKAEKIEEKSQNLEERLKKLTAEPDNTNNKMNDLFNTNNNLNNTNNISSTNNFFQNNDVNNVVNNNNQINNNNINKTTVNKKKAFFLDDDEDEDFNIKNKNVSQNTNNINNNMNINKNEPKIIMPKPMVQPTNISQQPQNNEPKLIMPKPVVQPSNIFQEQPKPKTETKKMGLFFFDNDEKHTDQNINKNVNNNANIINNNINQNNNNISKAPASLFDGLDNPKPEKKEEPKEKKKIPNFLFDEEEKSEPKPDKNESKLEKNESIIEKNTTTIKQENQQNNVNAQNNAVEVEKPAKKKVSLFDIFDTDKNDFKNNKIPENTRNTIANVNININKDNQEPKKEGIKKKESTKKLSEMFEHKPQEDIKKKSTFIPPKKIDFASRLSGFQNVLEGRMSMGGNVFTMPTGGIKTIKTSEIIHDEINKEITDENLKTEEREISKENMNAIIEENKIQETSYEKQLEKKKEHTVVVKKKKPKKIQFISNEIEEEEKKPSQNGEFNANNYIPPKIDLFANDDMNKDDINKDKKIGEEKPKMNMFDLFNDGNNNNEQQKKNEINLFNENENTDLNKNENKLEDKNNLFNENKIDNPIENNKVNEEQKNIELNNNNVVEKEQDNKPLNNNIENKLFEPNSNNNIFENNNIKNDSSQNNQFNIPQKSEENKIIGENIPLQSQNNNLFDNMNYNSDKSPILYNNNSNQNNINNIFENNQKPPELNINIQKANDNNIIIDNNAQKIPENMQPNLSANNNFNNNIPQFNQQQNIFNENVNQPKIESNNIFNNQVSNQSKEENNSYSIFTNNISQDNLNNNNANMVQNTQSNENNQNNIFNQNNNINNNQNIFENVNQIQGNKNEVNNLFMNSNNISNNINNENKPNIFMQENKNENKINIFMQENNQQKDTEPKNNTFKSMFEDDDDKSKKVSVINNSKNPIADKRLSFLFDDD